MNITPHSTFSAPSPTSNNSNMTGTLLFLGFSIVGAIAFYFVANESQKKRESI